MSYITQNQRNSPWYHQYATTDDHLFSRLKILDKYQKTSQLKILLFHFFFQTGGTYHEGYILNEFVTSNSFVSQIFSKTSRTLGQQRTYQQKSLCPIPLNLNTPVACSSGQFSFVQVDGSLRSIPEPKANKRKTILLPELSQF